MLSNEIETECCGTTCDKSDLVNKVKILECRVNELQSQVDEYERLRSNKERFTKQVFEAGYRANYDSDGLQKAWLNYRLEVM